MTQATATDSQIEHLRDKTQGLSADLDNAVRVAFSHGAEAWVRENYPDHYKRLTDELSQPLDPSESIASLINMYADKTIAGPELSEALRKAHTMGFDEGVSAATPVASGEDGSVFTLTWPHKLSIAYDVDDGLGIAIYDGESYWPSWGYAAKEQVTVAREINSLLHQRHHLRGPKTRMSGHFTSPMIEDSELEMLKQMRQVSIARCEASGKDAKPYIDALDLFEPLLSVVDRLESNDLGRETDWINEATTILKAVTLLDRQIRISPINDAFAADGKMLILELCELHRRMLAVTDNRDPDRLLPELAPLSKRVKLSYFVSTAVRALAGHVPKTMPVTAGEAE